jgi:hypothetical protein
MLDEVKYLEVTLDSKRSWNQHLQKIIRKAQTIFAVIRRISEKRGLRTNMVHWLTTHIPWYLGMVVQVHAKNH